MKIKNKVALFDIDDTIYNGGLIYRLMEAEVLDGLLDKKYIEEVYMYKAMGEKGEIEYEDQARKVVIAWAAGFKGVAYEKVAQHAQEFISRDLTHFYPFSKPLLSLLEKTHDRIIISNEPQFVGEGILKLLDFNDSNCTTFEIKDGVLTGNVSRFNSTQTDKKKSVREILANYEYTDSFAFGDSVGDIGMLEEVENPICINASKKLIDIARNKGWVIAQQNTVLELTSEILQR